MRKSCPNVFAIEERVRRKGVVVKPGQNSIGMRLDHVVCVSKDFVGNSDKLAQSFLREIDKNHAPPLPGPLLQRRRGESLCAKPIYWGADLVEASR